MQRNLKRLMRNAGVLFFTVMLIFCIIEIINQHYLLAGFMGAAGLILLIVNLATVDQRMKEIKSYIQTGVDTLSESATASAPYPVASVRLSDGEILWHNRQFQKALGKSEPEIGRPLSEVLPEQSTDWLKNGQAESPDPISIRDRRFRCLGHVPKHSHGESDIALLEWIDSTELLDTRDEYVRSRPVVSIILIDNYEELTGSLNDAGTSALNAALNERIGAWAEQIGGLLRRLERNRFLFLFEAKDLLRITEGKFSLLDSVREVTNPKGVAATVSFGVGKDGSGFQENYNYAALALEMALSRGGDQAVIKDRFDFSFYGGRSVETERRSKVKSRTVASSLSALIEQSSRIFLMGHKNADADAIGAAAGLVALCRAKGKPVNIVADVKTSTAPKLVELLRKEPQYKDVFLTGQEAILQADNASLLIVVDTNRPDQVESRALLESVNRIAVVDHHRRAADYIANAALAHHEPFASSTCELVAELLTYAIDARQILHCELAAMLAGIVLDTKNFTVRVNSRTFEAAAFLRLQGADTVEVKKFFQSDFEQTVRRYRIIENARVYRGGIAISCQDTETNRALAGQAADELLGIDGIEASFVLFRQGEAIFISARSGGGINVQVILEPMGGGGNAATAGAQLRGVSIETARARLIEAIDNYFNDDTGKHD